jgi:hypothetical protein
MTPYPSTNPTFLYFSIFLVQELYIYSVLIKWYSKVKGNMMSITQNVHCPGIDYLVVIDFEATCDENNTNPQAIQVTKVLQKQ